MENQNVTRVSASARTNKYVKQNTKRRIKFMYSQRGKKYIYSVERANEFIQRGYRCIETGFNAKQQRFFWVFDYEEVQDFYNDKASK